MCGIWGVIASSAEHLPVDAQGAQACVAGLRHRGPDGEGLVWDPPVALGHTRLAILDPSDLGRQPMTSADGRYQLVLNGEIFNYRELRAELAREGHTFRGTGDSEVLLAAYQQWGTDCLPRLNGMFAFAIVETARRSVLLARDRLGMKPLYYLPGDGFLGFCSEPKGLLAMLPAAPTLDAAAVSAFLSLRHVPAPRTFFAQLRQLPPATWLHWEPDSAPQAAPDRLAASGQPAAPDPPVAVEPRTTRWWDLADRRPVPPVPVGRDRRLRRLLADAVRLWSRSDVPVAAYLSGGLDSSVLLTELVRHCPGATAFTASYPQPGYSEREPAEQMAAHAGAPLRVISTDVAVDEKELAKLCRFRDHPLAMHNEVALFDLARHVQPVAPVVLSGEGADELFAGYGRLYRHPFEQRKRRLARLGRRSPVRAEGWRRHCASDSLSALLDSYSYLPMDVKLRLFEPGFRKALDDDSTLLRYLSTVWSRPRRVGAHRRLTYFMLNVHLPGLLHLMDATNMAHGVEARLPFLDHRVVEWAYRLPERAKLRWRGPRSWFRALRESPAQYSERRDVTKRTLRRAYRSVLPPLVLSRAKMPFPAPLIEWLSSPAGAPLRALVVEPGARLHQVLDVDELTRWWDGAAGGDPNFGKQAWLLINLEVWLRQYFPDGRIGMHFDPQEV